MIKNFLYGVSSSAFQIEGDDGTQGRGKSVWDEYCNRKNTIYNNQNAAVAIDHYNRLEEDLNLMEELGINSYRFSTSWSRLLPEGIGKINMKGVDFYDRLIDGLLERDILPFLTMYHWDLPEELSRKGGIKNPDFSKWFGEYAETIIRFFGDRVKNYITFNELINCIHSSYYTGVYAPGEKLNDLQILKCLHNFLIAHGVASEIIDDRVQDNTVSVAMSTFEEYPARVNEKCIIAARKKFFEREILTESVDLYMDPIYLGKYPERVFRSFPGFSEYVKEEDMRLISGHTNLLCINNYSGVPINEDGCIAEECFGSKLNDMGTPIDPNGLYWGCKFMVERYRKPIVISENGMANADILSEYGTVNDDLRIEYLNGSFDVVEKLKSEIDIKGYFIWSFTDNFEWLYGNTKRFGLVYIDYDTLKRIPKASFYRYADYIKNK